MQISLLCVPNWGVSSPGDVNYWGWARKYVQQRTFALRNGRFSHLEKLLFNMSLVLEFIEQFVAYIITNLY